MSDSNRVQFYELEETTLGTTPTDPLNELRFTGESLGHDFTTVVSGEIRNDRGITDVITVGQEETGAINFELSYGSYDNLLPGALYSGDWPTELTITASTIDAVESDSSFNDTGSGIPEFVAGQWVKVSGFTDTTNNGFCKVVSWTTAKLVVDKVLADESVGQSVTISGTMIRAATTRKSYTLEKEFADITQFQSFTGCVINTLSMEVAANSVLKGSFEFMGLASDLTQATVGTGSPVVANTNAVLNASSNVGDIQEGGAALGANVYIQSLALKLDNGLRPSDAIGSIAHVDIGVSDIDLTGTMNVYFKNNALFDKYMAGTESSFSFSVEDAAGNAYILTAPRIKFTNGNILAGGKGADVIAEMEWQGLRLATQNNTFQIDRFPA